MYSPKNSCGKKRKTDYSINIYIDHPIISFHDEVKWSYRTVTAFHWVVRECNLFKMYSACFWFGFIAALSNSFRELLVQDAIPKTATACIKVFCWTNVLIVWLKFNHIYINVSLLVARSIRFYHDWWSFRWAFKPDA